MMYNCEQVAKIVSESLDKKLPFWTRLQLRMHLAMCGLCVQFGKTMIRIDHEIKLKMRDRDLVEECETKLPTAAKLRLQKIVSAKK